MFSEASRPSEAARSQLEMYDNCLQLLARLGPTLGSSQHARQIVTAATLASIRLRRSHPLLSGDLVAIPWSPANFLPPSFPFLRLTLLLVKRLLRTSPVDEIEPHPSGPALSVSFDRSFRLHRHRLNGFSGKKLSF